MEDFRLERIRDLAKLRQKYGLLFQTRFPEIDLTVSWRPLSVYEFRRVQAMIQYELAIHGELMNTALIDNEIFNTCVIDDSLLLDIDDLPAGVVAVTAFCIRDISSCSDVQQINELINSMRPVVPQETLNFMASVIMTTYPGYQLKDLESLTLFELTRLFVMAESYLLQHGAIEKPFEFKAVEDKSEKQAKKPQISKEVLDKLPEIHAAQRGGPTPRFSSPSPQVGLPEIPPPPSQVISRSVATEQPAQKQQQYTSPTAGVGAGVAKLGVNIGSPGSRPKVPLRTISHEDIRHSYEVSTSSDPWAMGEAHKFKKWAAADAKEFFADRLVELGYNPDDFDVERPELEFLGPSKKPHKQKKVKATFGF